jgi:hypothetical protein
LQRPKSADFVALLVQEGSMGIDVQLDRIEAMLEKVILILESTASVAKIDELMEAVVSKKTIKDFYSTSEVAEMVNRSEFQVRRWCREGRVKAMKRAAGRGSHKEWMVSHEEIERYKSYGLRETSMVTIRLAG